MLTKLFLRKAFSLRRITPPLILLPKAQKMVFDVY